MFFSLKRGGWVMDEFKKPVGVELDENRHAIRRMRGLGVFLLLVLMSICFYFGMYVGWISFHR